MSGNPISSRIGDILLRIIISRVLAMTEESNSAGKQGVFSISFVNGSDNTRWEFLQDKYS